MKKKEIYENLIAISTLVGVLIILVLAVIFMIWGIIYLIELI